MTKRKISDAVRAALGGTSEPHVCVPRAKLMLILEACDAAGDTIEAPLRALDTIRALVTPYVEAE